MGNTRYDGSRRRTAVAGCAAGVVLLSATGASLVAGPAAASPAAARASRASGCAQADHRYVRATTATTTGGVTTVRAHPATFHCGGPDDGHYTVSHTTETLTLHANSVVEIFRNPENPSSYTRVKASALSRWLKRNDSEPIYRISGRRHHVTRMIEQFHP